MKIENGMATADKLLKLIKGKLRSVKIEAVAYVGAYQNGRENGYSVKFYDRKTFENKKVHFAETRSSDDIVIYPDSKAQEGIDDESFGKRMYFSCNQFEEAAEWCFNHLMNKGGNNATEKKSETG